jgi:hypothetical protein
MPFREGIFTLDLAILFEHFGLYDPENQAT